jgi:histidinol-phosphatase (PHP family)
MIDYHLHTRRCHHAVGDLEEYLEEARKKGLEEIGFADHFPLDLLGYEPKKPVTMAGAELHDYMADIDRLASLSRHPAIRLGIEVDYLPGREEETRRVLARYPFDYVLGSIHFLGDWDFTHPAQVKGYEEGCIETIYEDYFALVRRLAASRLFDIVGHIDVVKKFGYDSHEDQMKILIRDTVQALKENNLCIEVNTSGWRVPAAEQYPSRPILEACFRAGIPVTLGSDAHCPSHVGEGVYRAVELLKQVGYRQIARFRGRERFYTNL